MCWLRKSHGLVLRAEGMCVYTSRPSFGCGAVVRGRWLNDAPVLRSTPNQTIVPERGTDLGHQVHGLSYKAVLVVVLVVGFRRCSGALLRERRSYDIWGE
ncbi:unnamed protein product [Prunus armeniaca]